MCLRFIDGYTLRNYTLKGLILQDVAPPLDEISRFNQAGQAGELEDAMVSEASCGGGLLVSKYAGQA